jgi:hypothetical protein
MDSLHNIRVSRLSNAHDAAVFDTNVRLCRQTEEQLQWRELRLP